MKITGDGITFDVKSQSDQALVELPKRADGYAASEVRVRVVGFAYVRLGKSDVKVTDGDLLVANETVVLEIDGDTHIAARPFLGGTGSMPRVNVVPVRTSNRNPPAATVGRPIPQVFEDGRWRAVRPGELVPQGRLWHPSPTPGPNPE